MKKSFLPTSLLIIIIGLMWTSSLSEVLGSEYPFASDYDRTYTFDFQYGYYRPSHKLYASVPSSLYDYYRVKTPKLVDDSGYAALVTPYVFKSIAENLRNLTLDAPRSDEAFANAVLMLVHQIPYAVGGLKYPVETFVENSGQCDTLSLLAASIMKAGGLDVVLLYYKDVYHINVGVCLPYEPHGTWWWLPSAGFEFDGKKYWIAECTPAAEWKVGDVPSLVAGETPWVVSLENSEISSPARVSSKLDVPLTASSISIDLSSDFSGTDDLDRTLTISGSISPAYAGKSVVIYVNREEYSNDTFKTVTDNFGNYSLTWNFTSMGTYHIRTSLSGFLNYSGSDSETLTVFIGFYKQLSGGNVPEQYWGIRDGYLFAAASIAPGHTIFHSKGGEEFRKSNLTGTGILLSGEFMVLRSEQTTTPKDEQTTINRTITMPRRRWGSPRSIIEQTITTSRSEQTMNNQFGFILQHNGGDNYSASVRVLDKHDISQITEQGENNTAFISASMSAKENTWYKIAARMSEDGITANLHNENGTLLNKAAARDNVTSISESGILITYEANTVIAFKNLKAKTIGQPTQPVDGDSIAVNGPELLAPYGGLAILLAVVVATIAYIEKRKRVTEKKNS